MDTSDIERLPAGLHLLALALRAHPDTRADDWQVAYKLENGERTGHYRLLNERGEGDVFFPDIWLI